MIVETVPRNQTDETETPGVATALAKDSPRITPEPANKPPACAPAETEIRIHRNGLLIAKCHAIGLAPSILSVTIDPLNYPVNSRLKIQFVNGRDRVDEMALLPATVISRSINGIELRLDPK